MVYILVYIRCLWCIYLYILGVCGPATSLQEGRSISAHRISHGDS